MRAPSVATLLLLTLGCTPKPPPSWPQGGARLALTAARWDRGDESPIEIRPDGRVLEDGDLLFVLDTVGRIVDSEHEPFGILLAEGQVVGTDDRALGHVGVTNAAPPGSGNAWLTVLPDGGVTVFDLDGEREFAGRWQGCTGAAQRTCTLVSHLVLLRSAQSSPDVGIGIGIGLGVGF